MCYSKIENCYFTINNLIHSGMTQEDAWNETTIKLAKATEVIVTNYFYYTCNLILNLKTIND